MLCNKTNERVRLQKIILHRTVEDSTRVAVGNTPKGESAFEPSAHFSVI